MITPAEFLKWSQVFGFQTNQITITKTFPEFMRQQGFTVYQNALLYQKNNLTVTYNNGASGVGATLTNSGTLQALVVDGEQVQNGDSIVIDFSTNRNWNGIYTQTTKGSASVPYVLTRRDDFNQSSEIIKNNCVLVTNGDVYKNLFYRIAFANFPFNVGTDSLAFTIFSMFDIFQAT